MSASRTTRVSRGLALLAFCAVAPPAFVVALRGFGVDSAHFFPYSKRAIWLDSLAAAAGF